MLCFAPFCEKLTCKLSKATGYCASAPCAQRTAQASQLLPVPSPHTKPRSNPSSLRTPVVPRGINIPVYNLHILRQTPTLPQRPVSLHCHVCPPSLPAAPSASRSFHKISPETFRLRRKGKRFLLKATQRPK
ncbi:hypothetical protein E2C01_045938 [Portunus trituberculatus]|uniref:Uncharacterized protein n=1 Tax=Portunus trituberculatus TaxID=210409 RepID=A0A5B7G3A3_PORTR|nr:hypothetical protein [Portunus trituberculatus]